MPREPNSPQHGEPRETDTKILGQLEDLLITTLALHPGPRRFYQHSEFRGAQRKQK